MIGVDSNLLARFLLKDDPAQYRRALAILETGEEFFIPVTVPLELAWVLGARGVTCEEIAASLRAILALPHARPQHPDAVRKALGWVENGMDVADALHLALSEKPARFVTFDSLLTRRAARLGTRPLASAP